ncbi:MAG: DUF2007 domain-containing protein [Flavobacteriales bacterium]|nr:DUF2007 domain-containing protein [Flavobacteriales bacterium]
MTEEVQTDLIVIFTGSEVSALHLREILEANDVMANIKGDYHSGLNAAYGVAPPSSYELQILESDEEKAKPLIEEFLKDLNP